MTITMCNIVMLTHRLNHVVAYDVDLIVIIWLKYQKT